MNLAIPFVHDEKSHVDGTVKRMQTFLKKIGKTRKPSNSTPEETDNSTQERKDKKQEENSYEDRLKQHEKDVKSALTYYKVILDKNFIQKLPGTATAVLESVINAQDIINQCLEVLFKRKEFQHETSNVKPIQEELNRSITKLIRLSDDVLFDSYLHVRVDKTAAQKAIAGVLTYLGELYDFVIPKIRKCSLNEELLQFSQHGNSNNSLDALDNLPETDFAEYDPQLNVPVAWKMRDSGIASDTMSNYKSDTNSSNADLSAEPPPKPPLPRSNRNFYGNSKSPLMRKTLSHPGNITENARGSSENLEKGDNKLRPISDFSVDFSRKSSRSSLSTGSSVSLNTNTSNNFDTTRDLTEDNIAIQRRLNSIATDEKYNNDVFSSDEIGLSSESFTHIKKYSNRYEILARSTYSLFNIDDDDDDDDDDLLDDEIPEELPPKLPKKKLKHALNNDNYLQLIEGYQESDFKERPSSFYDNLPVPSVHHLTRDLFSNDDEITPQLPPKMYNHKNHLENDVSQFKSSPVIRKQRNSKRNSAGTYDEDNVAALDCKDVTHMLLFKDEGGNQILCGGTVDALIVYATLVDNNSLYYKAFLATYPTFIKPQTLICKLLYRANRFRDKGNSNNIKISRSVLSLLVKVMDEMFEELDKSLFDQLRSQVHRLLNIGELQLGKSLRDKIVNYCIKLQVNHIPIYQPTQSNDHLFDFKSLNLAQQMCVLDTDYFIRIELPEVLRWGKEQSETLSPNLSRFIGHFNSMSFWIRTLILKEPKQQDREKMYRKFLKIMRKLRELNNFSSFLAVLSALDSTPVRRLDWPKQFTELLAEDCKLMDSASSFKAYRQALSEAKPPCIPYLGLILTDITFIHLGNPQDLPDGKVNFVKRWQQYNILDSVRRFKQQLYDIERDEKILDFFHEYEDHLDEDEMWEKSQQLKPRGK